MIINSDTFEERFGPQAKLCVSEADDDGPDWPALLQKDLMPENSEPAVAAAGPTETQETRLRSYVLLLVLVYQCRPILSISDFCCRIYTDFDI